MKHSAYKIGLGNSFLLRARIIFLVTLLLFLGGGAWAIYYGAKSGKLEQYILSPFREYLAEVRNFFDTPEPTASTTPTYTFQEEVNEPVVSEQNPTPDKVYYTQPNNQSYEDALKAQDEWFKKVQEENQQKSEQWQKEYDQFVNESNQRYEDFKNQNPPP